MSYGNKPSEIKHSEVALLCEEYVVQRVQSLGYSADLNSEDVYQLTDANVVEVVDGNPAVSLTIDVNDFGSINLWNELGGYHINRDTDQTNFNSASGVVTLAAIEDYPIDFIVTFLEGGTTAVRSTWFNNCFLDSVSGTYQVDGFATESFSFSGTSQEWLLNDWARASVSTPAYESAASLDWTESVDDAVILTKNGIKLNKWTDWTFDGDKISAVGATTFSASDRFRVVSIDTGKAFPAPDSYTSNIGGIKEGEIEIILWDEDVRPHDPDFGTDGTAFQKLLRAQSVDYEVSFDREDLNQLYTGVYYKGLNSSSITATINVLDSDLELWSVLTGYSNDYSAASSDLTNMALTDFQSTTNISLRIDIFGSKNYLEHNSSTLLKYITMTGGKVTSVNDSFDVPGRGSQTFELTFTGFQVNGTGLTGR